MITQIGMHTVVVKDLSKALKFYRDKLKLRVVFYNRKMKWLTFDCGTTLSITTAWNREARKLCGKRTGISFFTEDLEKTYKQLVKRGVKFRLLPHKRNWGGLLASFEDPDGNAFFLLQMPSDFKK